MALLGISGEVSIALSGYSALAPSIHHPCERRMLPVLDLDPMRRPAGTIRPVFQLRHQTLQPHQAGVAEQLRTDLALFERRQMDAVDTAPASGGQVCSV